MRRRVGHRLRRWSPPPFCLRSPFGVLTAVLGPRPPYGALVDAVGSWPPCGALGTTSLAPLGLGHHLGPWAPFWGCGQSSFGASVTISLGSFESCLPFWGLGRHLGPWPKLLRALAALGAFGHPQLGSFGPQPPFWGLSRHFGALAAMSGREEEARPTVLPGRGPAALSTKALRLFRLRFVSFFLRRKKKWYF